MMNEADVRTPGLPPKPDPRTGQPRPPRAPLEPGWKLAESKHRRGLSKVPSAPEGEGPIIEWFYPTRGMGIMMGAILSVIMLVFFTWRDWGFSWMATWWLWLFIVPWPFAFLLINRNIRMSAGVEWLRYDRAFIKTYELTSIDVTIGGVAHYIEMWDRHGNGMRCQINKLQLNRELWDLVWLGMLHSVHENGATMNQRAKEYLSLNIPPHLRNWDYE